MLKLDQLLKRSNCCPIHWCDPALLGGQPRESIAYWISNLPWQHLWLTDHQPESTSGCFDFWPAHCSTTPNYKTRQYNISAQLKPRGDWSLFWPKFPWLGILQCTNPPRGGVMLVIYLCFALFFFNLQTDSERAWWNILADKNTNTKNTDKESENQSQAWIWPDEGY